MERADNRIPHKAIAARVKVNAIIEGNRVTIFDNRGIRIAKVSLWNIQGDDEHLSDSWKWNAMLQIHAWRLSQQTWKSNQTPWEKKIAAMVERIASDTRDRKVRRGERIGRPADPPTNWDQALFRMQQTIYQCATRTTRFSMWRKWANARTKYINTDPRMSDDGKDQEETAECGQGVRPCGNVGTPAVPMCFDWEGVDA